jgi:hypothetical protein
MSRERATPVMRIPPGFLLGRAIAGVTALTALCAPGAAAYTTTVAPATRAAPALPAPALPAPAAAAPEAPDAPELEHVPFTERYRALRHGGVVRAAAASATCRTGSTAPARGPGTADACRSARAGGPGVNGDFDMTYVDVDDDPNTYNSSRAELRLPAGAYVSYARLYWGGNLRVGEQKPPRDNGRVLVAEPGGRYKELLADTVVGHRTGYGADAYQASADVTGLVRGSGSGAYTVAQVNVAMGRSDAGAWGGWTLVVAYEKESEPLRHLALWDGFEALAPDTRTTVGLRGLPFAPDAHGRVGLVAYNGDRGRTGDSLSAATRPGAYTVLSDSANPGDDVLNSTISDDERPTARPNTLGYDSDMLDLSGALRDGGDQLDLLIVSQRDAAWLGALFVAVDAQQ